MQAPEEVGLQEDPHQAQKMCASSAATTEDGSSLRLLAVFIFWLNAGLRVVHKASLWTWGTCDSKFKGPLAIDVKTLAAWVTLLQRTERSNIDPIDPPRRRAVGKRERRCSQPPGSTAQCRGTREGHKHQGNIEGFTTHIHETRERTRC